MRITYKTTAITLLLFAALTAYAKSLTVTIKSSLVCEMCEENIRDGLIYEKGIKRITFDLEKSEIYVKYNPKQTDLQEIKAKIIALGYTADELKADKKAFEGLPGCCKSKEACEALEKGGS